MMRKAVESDGDVLMDYLYKEPVFHTYLIADIEIYGFDKNYQTIYMQVENAECAGVILRYYNNILIAGDPDTLNYQEVLKVIDNKVTTIMGRAEVIEPLNQLFAGESSFNTKIMYVMPEPIDNPEYSDVQLADQIDADGIYEFLMGIPEIRGLYTEKAMITNRIQSGEGVHAIIRKNGDIIAHGNSAATTRVTGMIGGLCVDPKWRGKGYAKAVIGKISEVLWRENRKPCVFAEETLGQGLLKSSGFVKYGEWGVINRFGYLTEEDGDEK